MTAVEGGTYIRYSLRLCKEEVAMNDVAVVNGQERGLTAADFVKLAEAPPEIEWFANLRNRNTRAAYEQALQEF
jgi:hypothetical protein